MCQGTTFSNIFIDNSPVVWYDKIYKYVTKIQGDVEIMKLGIVVHAPFFYISINPYKTL